MTPNPSTSGLDLSTPEGVALARASLARKGWPACEMTLDGLLSLCSDAMLRELTCRFAESVLPAWELEYPDDDRPRRAVERSRTLIESDQDAGTPDPQGKDRLNALWSATEGARLAAVRAGAVAFSTARSPDKELAGAAAFDAARSDQLALTLAFMLE